MKHLSVTSLLWAVGAVAFGAPDVPAHGVVVEVWDDVKGDNVKEVADVSGRRAADSVYLNGTGKRRVHLLPCSG